MRIAGINIPDEKRTEVALRYIYGVGATKATEIIKATKIDPDKRAKDLTQTETNAIKEYLDKNIKIEGELRQ